MLVVFCCSLVLACISPAFAETTSGDPNSFAVYAAFSGTTNGPLGSAPLVVPASGHHVFCPAGSKQDYVFKIRPIITVPEIVPVDFNRTFVLNLGFQGAGYTCNSETLYNYGNVRWYASSYQEQIFENGIWVSYDSMVTPSGLTKFYKIIIPATATSLQVRTPNQFVYTGNGSPISLVSFGGYVVDTDNQDIVDVVSDILAQVQQINSTTGNINSKLSSCLSALNSILGECKALNADTDTIITVLNAVKSQLVTLNGKVDNIYTLLKDSLKAESAAVDKKSQQLGEQIMQRVDSEQFWADKNSETFNALDMGNFSFGDGVVGALPTVGNLFKSLWDSFGDVTLIFTFPLMLGIALVIVGRISRTSGKGSKKGGDD